MEKTSLMRRMKIGEPSLLLNLASAKENNSFSVLLSRYNLYEGKDANKHIHAAYDNKEATVELVCISYEDYLKEKSGELPPDYWRQFLRKKTS